jgi:hypothetical protein
MIIYPTIVYINKQIVDFIEYFVSGDTSFSEDCYGTM